MSEVINEKISVVTVYSLKREKAIPWKIQWKRRVYTINEIGLHYTKKVGQVLHHFFSVTAGNLHLLLDHNTESLTWTLKEISDGAI